uniref:Uncharacterized protein n=1 Tax=Opuntia streptacantha TaxID=393608 RepID=A0A7C9ENA2_OPUST
MPRLEFPETLEVVLENEPRAAFCMGCEVPGIVPDTALMPDCPEDNTVWEGGTVDAIPLDIMLDMCIPIGFPPIEDNPRELPPVRAAEFITLAWEMLFSIVPTGRTGCDMLTMGFVSGIFSLLVFSS